MLVTHNAIKQINISTHIYQQNKSKNYVLFNLIKQKITFNFK